MNYIGKVAQGFKDFYYEINPATLTGAIDVVVVQHIDGSFKSSPFHVRFGKLALIKTKDLTVDIQINGQPVDLHMKLGEAGEAYFVDEKSIEEESSSSCESLNNDDERKQLKRAKSSEPLIEVTQADVNTNTNNPPITITDTSKMISVKVTDETATNESNATKIINFFSDGEITPELTSPAVSRPPSPKSDTEAELISSMKSKNPEPSSPQWSWSWGQLPEKQAPKDSITNSTQKNTTTDTVTAKGGKDSKTSSSSSRLLGSMFNLIGSNSNEAGRAIGSSGSGYPGKQDEIYLDETEKLDSEVAALYLNQKNEPKSKKPASLSIQQTVVTKDTRNEADDDQESGNGLSLPQSPRLEYFSILGDVQISLCGFIPINQASSAALTLSSSSIQAVTGSPNPNLLSSQSYTSVSNSNLPSPNTSTSRLSDIGTVNSPAAALLSSSPQPPNLLGASPKLDATISNELAPVSTTNEIEPPANTTVMQLNFDDFFQNYAISFEKFLENIHSISSDPNLVIKINNRYMNWASASPIILSAIVYQKQLPNELINSIMDANMPKNSNKQAQQSNSAQNQTQTKTGWRKGLFFSWRKNNEEKPIINGTASVLKSSENRNNSDFSATAGMLMDEDLMKTQSQIIKGEDGSLKQADDELNFNSLEKNDNERKIRFQKSNSVKTSKSEMANMNKLEEKKYKITTRLTSEQLAQLNLNSGANEIIYSVTTALQGTTRITSYIFLWNYDDKVVVSDIDGTITKSDVWGQVLPIFGRDWTQAGVADLYSAIEKNQYKFMYLSARAIGQSRITRDLLKNVNQGGLTLPKGPLLVTPTSLFTAFQKEVIEKKPEEFKISCLRDVRSLFPEDHNPFYAGYGNKTSDVTAYKTVGIPVSRIFTINPQGELKHEVSRTFQSSYSNLCDFVDLIFPPLKPSAAIIKAEYDSFNFWRNNHVEDTVMAEIELELKNNLIVTNVKETKETSIKVKSTKSQTKTK